MHPDLNKNPPVKRSYWPWAFLSLFTFVAIVIGAQWFRSSQPAEAIPPPDHSMGRVAPVPIEFSHKAHEKLDCQTCHDRQSMPVVNPQLCKSCHTGAEKPGPQSQP